MTRSQLIETQDVTFDSVSSLGVRQEDPELAAAPLRPRVLIVDGQELNRRMLRSMLRPAFYDLRECSRASEAMEVLERENIDLVVLDLVLPEVSGPELCRWLKTNRRTRFIPVLMLTSVQGVQNEIAGISSGADEFLIKPVHPSVVRARISAMLRSKALTDSLEEAETILFALAQAVEQRDKCTGLHCDRLARYSLMLGEALGLTGRDLTALYRGGYLHDIGKICVPDAILFKQGKLTKEEWVIMEMHTVQGERICSPMKSLAPVLPIIRSHHERWDGSGYPDRLTGTAIPLLARILQIADIYDALTTARPYKQAFSRGEAIEIMTQEMEKGWRDPELLAAFIELIRSQPEDSELASMRTSLRNMQNQLG